MWLFCTYGFYSTTKAPDRPGWVQVRARRREDLVRLAERFVTAQCPIQATPERDYPYRIVLRQGAWADIVACIADDIDYANFKDRVHEVDPDPERSSAYLSVWGIMARFGGKAFGSAVRQARTRGKWQNKILR